MAQTKKTGIASKSVNGSKILIRGVNWLGDAVMTFPALDALKEKFPASPITVISHAKLSALYQLCPSVTGVISFESTDGLFGVSRLAKEAKADMAIIFPNSPRSAMEMFLARIPRRLGYARPWRSLFLTQTVPPYGKEIAMRKRSKEEILALTNNPVYARQHTPISAHHLHHYLNLVGHLGCNSEPTPPRLEVPEKMFQDFCAKFGLRAGVTYVGINPGAEYGPAKRWPVEKFIETMKHVEKSSAVHWLLFGGNGDFGLCEEIKSKLASFSITNLAGKTSLMNLCAGLKLCDVVLTNDTGPMHMAAAVGSKVVVPFGSTSPELTGPGWPPLVPGILQSTVPCSPCFRKNCPIDFRCMESITAQMAAEKILGLLPYGRVRSKT